MWEKRLTQVRIVSKQLQAPDVDLNLVTELLNTTDKHFRDMRASFTTFVEEAKAFAEDHGVSKQFEVARVRKVKRFHDELACDERLQNSSDRFRVNVFTVTVDTCIAQLEIRFKSFQSIKSRFGFMMPRELNQISDDELKRSATEFAKRYDDDVSDDVVGQFLALRSCGDQVKALKSPRDILQFIIANKLQSTLPDVVTCYILFLTLPVTVASCERSFSKLRIIKNYLRSSCGQERLSALALLSIESQIARALNMDDLIKDFASRKARRKL